MKKVILGLVLLVYAVLLFFGIKEKVLDVNYNDDPIYQKILSYASSNNIDPIDAKYDLIWKRIPGLNGRIVDVEKSYENMKNDNIFDENKIIYKTAYPKKTLNNLQSGPIYKGNNNKKQVSFMINVAWGKEYINDMLEVLKNNNIKATFFIDGKFLEENEELVKKIYTNGNEIGNHGYNHVDFTKLSKKEAKENILKTNNLLTSITNEPINLFSPPSLAFSNSTISALDDLNMQLMMYSIDTIDWQNPSVDLIKKRVLDNVSCGSIILMHPTKNTVDSLNDIIIEINKKGLEIVTISTLISPEL